MAESSDDHRGKTKRRWPRRVAAALVVALLVWLLFFANWPTRDVANVQLTQPGGVPVVLTLVTADPVVELPYTTNTACVRCGDRRWKLHGREFGGGVGRVAVSPDGMQAVVHNSFQGSEFPAVLIDLRTQQMQEVSRWTDYKSLGWTLYSWQRPETRPAG